jgi:hypothetical protein
MKNLFGTKSMLVLFCALLLAPAQAQKMPEGIWQGYDGEWKHVTSQLVALAEATPEDKFGWRPAKGVRSTSEVYMHIVLANFICLALPVRRCRTISKKAWRRPLRRRRTWSSG